MATNAITYIRNLGKSVGYSAIDKVKKMTPVTASFVETNGDLFKDVYSVTKNYKTSIKNASINIKKSKVYEAANEGRKAILEDLASGTFYNRERINKFDARAMGSLADGLDGGDDLPDFNSPKNDGFDLGEDFNDWNINDGDAFIGSIVDRAGEKSSKAISSTMSKVGQYIVDSNNANTNVLYTQQAVAFESISAGITAMNKNLTQVFDVVKTVQTHAENSKVFYETVTALDKERNDLLRQLVDMQKSLNQTTLTQKSSNKKKLTYDDIVSSEGAPDLKLYAQNVKKNISSMDGGVGGMLEAFGDGNLLLTFASSPLKMVTDKLIDKMVPQIVEQSVNNFNESLKGFFGSFILKMNTMTKDDNPILRKVGEILGVKNGLSNSLDSSKYIKGPVPFDGKTRKAIIEVIPTYLSKILSVLSGKGEKIMDYDKGRFVNASDIEKGFKDISKRNADTASSDMKEEFQKYMKLISFKNKQDKDQLEKDISKFFESMFMNGEMFDYNNEDEYAYSKYGISPSSYKVIKTMFKKSPKWKQQQINANILSGRTSQTRYMDQLQEQGDSIFNMLHNNFNPDEFLTKNKNGKIKSINSALNGSSLALALDDKGHNVFYYLQNMYRELMFIRQAGTGVGNSTINGQTITTKDGRTMRINALGIGNMQIDDRHIKSEIERDQESERRNTESFERRAIKEREKNKKLLKYEDLMSMEDKDFSATLGGRIESSKIEQKVKDYKLTLVDKLLMADSLSSKSKVIVDNISELAKKPAKFIASVMDKADQRLYQIIYGNPNDKSSKGFLTELIYRLQNTFDKFNTWMDENILEPIKKKLGVNSIKEFGKKMIASLFGIDPDEMAESMKQYLFGNKDSDGKRHGGLIGDISRGVKDSFNDAFGWVKNSFKEVFGPLIGKVKERFKGKKKSKDENDMMSIIDDAGNITKQKRKSVQEMIESNQSGLDKNRQTKGQKQKDIYSIIPEYENATKMKKMMDLQMNGMSMDEYLESQGLSDAQNRMGHAKNKKEYKNLYSKIRGLNKFKSDYSAVDELSTYKLYEESLKSLLGLSDDDELSKQLIGSLKNVRGKHKGVHNLSMLDLYDTSLGLEKSNPEFTKITDDISNMMAKMYDNVNKSIQDVVNDAIDREVHKDRIGETDIQKRINESLGVKNHTSLSPEEISKNYITEATDKMNNMDNKKQGGLLFTIQKVINSIDSTAKKILGVIKARRIDDVADLFDPNGVIPGHAKGAKVINKTGLAVLSEGEMVIPSEYNPFYKEKKSKKQQIQKENKVKNRFLGLLNKRGIPGFANGTESVSEEDFDNKKKSNFLNMDFLRHANKDKKDDNDEYEINPLMKDIVTEFVNGIKVTKRELFGDSDKKNRERFATAVEDVTSKISDYAPPAIAGGLMGAGASLITGAIGGPLLGAAAGAGISLIKDSEKVRNWLFGDIDKEGDYTGGVISKDISNNIKKYFPDMAKYGVVGGITSILPFVPGGPVAGLIVGSAVGFAKNNDQAQKALFGDENGEGGLISPKFKEQVEKALPRMGAGAIAGVIGGPFGLVGNAMLGSALGFATTTNEFKDLMFGREDQDGERKGGLFGTIRTTVVDPLKQFMKDSREKVFGWIQKNMLEPLKSAFDPIKKEIQLAIKGMFNMVGTAINKLFESALGIPLNKFIEDKIIKPFTKVFTGLFKVLLSPAKFVISSPFKAVGAVGNYLRSKQIKHGNADYMTSRQRLDFRKKRGMSLSSLFGDKFVEFDKTLSEMDPDSMDEMMQDLSYLKNTHKNTSRDVKESMKNMGSEVANHYSYDDTKAIMKLIRDKKFSKVGKYINNSSIKDEEKTDLLNFLEKEGTQYSAATDARDNTERFKESLFNKLRKKGFKDINDKNINKYITMTQNEIRSRKPIDPKVEVEQKNHTEIVDLFKETIHEIKKINDPTYQAAQKESIDTTISRKMKKTKKFTYTATGEPIKLVLDKEGDEVIDTSDSETNKVLREQENRDNTQRGILRKLGNLDILKKLFGTPSKKSDPNKSLLNKVFDWVSIASVFATAIAAALNGEFGKLKDYIGLKLGYNGKDGEHNKKAWNNKLKVGAALFALRGHSVENLVEHVPVVGKVLRPVGHLIDTPTRILAHTDTGQMLMGDKAASRLLGKDVKNPLTRYFEGKASSIENNVIGGKTTKSVARSADKMVKNSAKDADKLIIDKIGKGKIASKDILSDVAKTHSDNIYKQAKELALKKGLSEETAEEIASSARDKSFSNITDKFDKKSTTKILNKASKMTTVTAKDAEKNAVKDGLKYASNRSDSSILEFAEKHSKNAYNEAYAKASKIMSDDLAKQYAQKAANDASDRIINLAGTKPGVISTTVDVAKELTGQAKNKMAKIVSKPVNWTKKQIASTALAGSITGNNMKAKIIKISNNAKDTMKKYIADPMKELTQSLSDVFDKFIGKPLQDFGLYMKKKIASTALAGSITGETIKSSVNSFKNKVLQTKPVRSVVGKFTERMGTTMTDDLGRTVAKDATQEASKGVLNTAKDFIMNGLRRLVESPVVSKFLGKKGVVAVVGNFAKGIIEHLGKSLGKGAAKFTAKLSATIASAGLVNVAFAAGGFLSGFTDANMIFKIDGEPSLAEKACAGLIRAVNQFILFGLIPDDILVDLVIKYVMPALGMKNTGIQKERNQTQKNLDAENMKAFDARNKKKNKKYKGVEISQKQLDTKNMQDYNKKMKAKDPKFKEITNVDDYIKNIKNKGKDKSAMTMTDYLADRYNKVKIGGHTIKERDGAPKSMNDYLDKKYGGSFAVRTGREFSKMGKGISDGISSFMDDPKAAVSALGDRAMQVGKVIKNAGVSVVKAILGPIADVIKIATGMSKKDYWDVSSGKKGIFAGIGEFVTLSERVLLFPVYLVLKAGATLWDKVKDNPAVKAITQAGSYVFKLVKYNIDLALGNVDKDTDLAKSITIKDSDPDAGIKKVLFYGTDALMLPIYLGLKLFSKVSKWISPLFNKLSGATSGLFKDIIDIGGFIMKDVTNDARLLIKGDFTLGTFKSFYKMPSTKGTLGGLKTVLWVGEKILTTIPFTIGMIIRQAPSLVQPIFDKVKGIADFVGTLVSDNIKFASTGITKGWGTYYKCPSKYTGLEKVLFYTTRILSTPGMAVMKLLGIGSFIEKIKDMFIERIVKPFVDFFDLNSYFNFDKMSGEQKKQQTQIDINKNAFKNKNKGAYENFAQYNKDKYSLEKSLKKGSKESYSQYLKSTKRGADYDRVIATKLFGISQDEYTKHPKTYDSKVENAIFGMKSIGMEPTKQNYAKYKKMSAAQIKAAKAATDAKKKAATKKKAGKGSGLLDNSFVSQIDPSISNQSFNNINDTIKQTIGDSGCAPASATMVINKLTGKNANMESSVKFALNNNYKAKDSGTKASYFKDIFGKYGINTKYTTGLNQDVLGQLRNGSPVVLMGTNEGKGGKRVSPFGPNPHYVVATGLSNDGKSIIVNDPESSKPGIKYSTKQLMKNTKLGVIPYHGKGSGLLNNYVGFGNRTAEQIANQDLGVFTSITVDQMNNWIAYERREYSPFHGQGAIFIEASQKSGLDPRYILAHAAIESGWGTSNICRAKGNYFGIGAFDNSPMQSAYTFSPGNLRSCIIAGAMWIKKNFYNRGQKSLNQMQIAPHRYATDPDWAHSISSIMVSAPQSATAGFSFKYLSPSSYLKTNSGSSIASTVSQYTNSLDSILSVFDNAGYNYYGDLISKLYLGNDSSTTTTSSTPTVSSTVKKVATSVNTTKVGKSADSWFAKNLKGSKKTSDFSMRSLGGVTKFHDGIDYAVAANTPIPSPVSGTVIMNSYEAGGGGNMLAIRDSKGYVSTFMHMISPSPLKVGSKVKTGQIIGHVGSTGHSTGPHLHYRVHDPKGNKMNPNDYFKKVIGAGSGIQLDTYQAAGSGLRNKNTSINNIVNKISNSRTSSYETVKVPITSRNTNKSSNNNLRGKGDGLDNTEINKLIKSIVQILLKVVKNTDQLTSIVKLLTEYFKGSTTPATKKAAKSNITKIVQQSSNTNGVDPDIQKLIENLSAIASE